MIGPTQRSEAGSVTLEIAVLAPVLLLVIFSIVQLALWAFARNLALAAAQEGASAGSARGASAELGAARAQRFLATTGADSLTGVVVSSAGSNARTVKVQVSGRSLSVLPGVPGIAVNESALAPVERFTSEVAP